MRLFDIRGRANRATYFRHTFGGILLFALVLLILGYSSTVPSSSVQKEEFFPVLAMLAFLAVFADGMAVTVRRLHDLGRPGVQALFLFIPLYGLYLEYQLLFVKGTEDENQYGGAGGNADIRSLPDQPHREIFCLRCGEPVHPADPYCPRCREKEFVRNTAR